jgi:hypothetical protein
MLELKITCNICGIEAEDGHHAMVQCTKEEILRHFKEGTLLKIGRWLAVDPAG